MPIWYCYYTLLIRYQMDALYKKHQSVTTDIQLSREQVLISTCFGYRTPPIGGE